MNIEDRKRLEDKVAVVLESLTRGEKAVLYKTLYAEGFKISDCEAIIRKEPPPMAVTAQVSNHVAPPRRIYPSRGWPPMK